MDVPKLGVGVVYWPELEPLIARAPGLVDVLEIEPQAFWYELDGAGGAIRCASDILAGLQLLQQRKLIHSVGCPLGGSHPPDKQQLALLRQFIEELDAAWITEHLSFNRIASGEGSSHALFLLPPLQTWAGVETAVQSVRAFASQMPCPVSIETGVNYLQPRVGEMSDGSFIAAVAETADCGILLDLHNLLANERNGRQPVRELLAELPLDRVREIHLAGGFEQDGYWLDAHSTEADEELLQLCKDTMPELPNLGAIIFEMLPTFIPRMGLDRLERHLEQLRELWDNRNSSRASISTQSRPNPVTNIEASNDIDVTEWERTLSALVAGRNATGELACHLVADPGVAVLRRQIQSFRRGMVSQALTMTLRLLLLNGGDELVQRLFLEYWKSNTPQPFTSTESRRFAEFLAGQQLDVPYLSDVLAIELAAIRAQVERKETVVRLTVEPIELMRQLGEGRLPINLPYGNYELEMKPDIDEKLPVDQFTAGH